MLKNYIDASRVAEAQACDCKRVKLWVGFPYERNEINIYMHSLTSIIFYFNYKDKLQVTLHLKKSCRVIPA